MEINKVSYDKSTVKVEYSTDAGEFKIKTDDTPTGEFAAAIGNLKAIYLRNMNLDMLTDRIKAVGFEHGSNDEGEWWRILGVLDVNNLPVKIPGFKMSVPKEYDDQSFWDSHEPDEYPTFLTGPDVAALENAWEQTRLFIQGERTQRTLDFADDDNAEDDGSDGMDDEDDAEDFNPFGGGM